MPGPSRTRRRAAGNYCRVLRARASKGATSRRWARLGSDLYRPVGKPLLRSAGRGRDLVASPRPRGAAPCVAARGVLPDATGRRRGVLASDTRSFRGPPRGLEAAWLKLSKPARLTHLPSGPYRDACEASMDRSKRPAGALMVSALGRGWLRRTLTIAPPAAVACSQIVWGASKLPSVVVQRFAANKTPVLCTTPVLQQSDSSTQFLARAARQKAPAQQHRGPAR